jgi:hypothetical protein
MAEVCAKRVEKLTTQASTSTRRKPRESPHGNKPVTMLDLTGDPHEGKEAEEPGPEKVSASTNKKGTETKPPSFQAGLASTRDIQEVFSSTAIMIQDQVRRERASGRKFDPEEWSPHATKPGFMKKLLRVLDDLEGYGEEGPGPANLIQQESDPEGARHGEPHSAESWNPDGKKEKPRSADDDKGRSSCGMEHSRDSPWVASDGMRNGEPYGTIPHNPEERSTKPRKELDNKRKPGCGTEHNLSLLKGAGHKHKLENVGQDQCAIPRPHKVGKHRQEGRTKPPEEAEQGPAPSRAEDGPGGVLRQKKGGELCKSS